MATQLELRLGMRSLQLYRSWSSIMRYVALSPVVSRDARTTMSARSIAHAARCDAAACFARRKAKPAQTKQHSTPSRDPTSLFPLRGTVNRVPSLRGVSPSRASLPSPPSRDGETESPPFEEFPLRGLPFLFPLRGTVKPSPLPSRSFPFEGFPDRARPPRLRRAYHDAHAS